MDMIRPPFGVVTEHALPPIIKGLMSVNTTEKTLMVLDTNVALDLWLFGPQRGGDKVHAVAATHSCINAAHVVGTAAMRGELAEVLRRSAAGLGPIALRWLNADRVEQVLCCWDAQVEVVDAPQTRPSWPQCRDRSDQKFIDLALSVMAPWLVTRDRALLALARRCKSLNLAVATPEVATAVLAQSATTMPSREPAITS